MADNKNEKSTYSAVFRTLPVRTAPGSRPCRPGRCPLRPDWLHQLRLNKSCLYSRAWKRRGDEWDGNERDGNELVETIISTN